MIKNNLYNRVFALIILISIFVGSIACFQAMVHAADDSESYYNVFDSNGDPILKVTMKNGTITIIGMSAQATTSTRWETIGLNITKQPITTEMVVKDILGFGPVNDAGKAYYFDFDNATKTESRDNGVVTTKIVFDESYVSKILGEDFSDVEKDTIIYMHAAFRSYDNDTKATLTGPHKNWEGIMNAQWWGADTLKDFKKYYNMQIKYKPADQENTLYYVTSDDHIIGYEEIESGFIGDTIYWDNKPLEKTYKSKTYTIDGVYITPSDDTDDKKEEYYVGDTCDGGKYTKADMQSGFAEIYPGGTNVYLVYKKADDIKPTPTPTPSPIPVPTDAVKPTPTPIAIPEAETISVAMNSPTAIGCIRADDRGSEKFTVTAGIPTTESLYTQVNATQWLLGYTLQKKVGVETYAVTVKKNYILKWTGEDEEGEEITLSETVPISKVVNIQRAYGYWEVQYFDLFKIGSSTITNYALPDGTTTMLPNFSTGYSPPGIVINHSSNKDSHLIIPSEVTNGFTLNSETITSGNSKPSIPNEDFAQIADNRIDKLKVKNDYIKINNTVVMDATATKTEGPRVDEKFLEDLRTEGILKCNEYIMYKPKQVIEATKKNGVFNTSGVITYVKVGSVNASTTSTLPSSILNLNSVTIHTPVLCNPIVNADNDKYVQLIKPTNGVQLVLDPDYTLNDFTVNISNYGLHSYKQGYYTRDFSRSLIDPENISYIAKSNELLRNEIKFPFDVYIKQASGEDTFVAKNTWVILGRNTITFYLPMWVTEGTYTVSCRTIAVNADTSKLNEISENYFNSELFNYVATNTFSVEISGRLYGLSIYDLTDYPIWEEVFRVKDSLDLKINDQNSYPEGTNKTTYSKGYSYNYTVGTKDQYGNNTGRNEKYTFPLVNGSHPYYKNIGILKTGYVVRFKLNTIGNMYSSGNYIKIKPSFYYVDANGENRIAVDLYYEEAINGKNQKLIKMGNSLDQINMKYMETGSPYTGIPTIEMKNAASILSTIYSKFISKRDSIFTFKDIRIPSTFRTFINNDYANKILNSNQYSKIQTEGITKNVLMKQMQSWYGCYYLPGILHVAPLDYDVYDYAKKYGVTFEESFWKDDGYIIVNFDIVTVDDNGNERLSYINASNYLNKGNNSMWLMEGANTKKTDNKETVFNFKAGDFIIYYTDKSVQDDYIPGGIY